MPKSWAAIAVLATLLLPAVAVLVPAARDCTDHACQCMSRRAGSVGRPESCHGAAQPAAPPCEVRSGCRHEMPVLLDGSLPYLAPAATGGRPLTDTRVIASSIEARRPLAGVLRIDSPPPERG